MNPGVDGLIPHFPLIVEIPSDLISLYYDQEHDLNYKILFFISYVTTKCVIWYIEYLLGYYLVRFLMWVARKFFGWGGFIVLPVRFFNVFYERRKMFFIATLCSYIQPSHALMEVVDETSFVLSPFQSLLCSFLGGLFGFVVVYLIITANQPPPPRYNFSYAEDEAMRRFLYRPRPNSVRAEAENADELNSDIPCEAKYSKGHKEKGKRELKLKSDAKKKIQEKKRKEGIKKARFVRPEWGPSNIVFEGSFADLDQQTANQLLITLMNSNVPSTMTEVLVNTVARISSFLLKLSLCTDWKSSVTVFTTLVLDNISYSTLIDALTGSEMTRPEAGFQFNVTKWKEGIKSFKSNLSLLKDTPGYNFIKKGLTILVFTGVTSQTQMESSRVGKMITEAFGVMDRQTQIGDLTFASACIDILEFALAAIECYQQNGCVYNLLFPKTAITKLAELTSYLNAYKQGSIVEVANMTPTEYLDAVMKLKLELEVIVTTKSFKGAAGAMHESNYKAASKLLVEVQSFQYSTRYRIQPWGIIVHGSPGCGKSTIAMNLASGVLTTNGMKLTPKSLYFPKQGDKYNSGWRNDMDGMLFDDLGNMRNDAIDPADTPQSQLIHIINNVPSPAIAAAIEDKGYKFHTPAVVVGTTNVIDAGFRFVTHCFEAYERRLYFVHVEVRPEFRNEDGSLKKLPRFELNGEEVDPHTFQFYIPTIRGQSVKKRWTSGMMSGPVFYKYVSELSRAHFQEQRRFVNRQNAKFDSVKCPSCGQIPGSPICICTPEDIEEAQREYDELSKIPRALKMTSEEYRAEAFLTSNYLDSPRVQTTLHWIVNNDFAARVCKFWYNAYYSMTRPFPARRYIDVWTERAATIIISPVILTILRGTWNDVWKASAGIGMMITSCATVPKVCLATLGLTTGTFTWYPIACLYTSFYIMSGVHRYSRSLVQADTLRRVRENISAYPMVSYAFVSLGVGITAYRMLAPHILTPRAETLSPKNMEDVQERKEETDIWCELHREPLPAPMEVKSMTFIQVRNDIVKNLNRIWLHAGNLTNTVGSEGQGFMINPNYMIIPAHAGDREIYQIRGLRRPEVSGRPSSSRFTSALVGRTRIGTTDFAIYRTEKAMPASNMLKYFPTEYPTEKTACLMVTFRRDCYVEQNIMFEPQYTSTEAASGRGGNYKLEKPTEYGDCMSVIISRTAPHHILGFHMGSDTLEKGVGFTLLLDQIVGALPNEMAEYDHELFQEIISQPEFDSSIRMEMESPSSMSSSDPTSDETDDWCPGCFEETVWKLDEMSENWTDFVGTSVHTEWLGLRNQNAYDPEKIVVEVDHETHPRSCVNFLAYDSDRPATIHYYGEDPKFISRPKSQVKKSIISDALEKHGYPSKWGPPPMHSGRAHSKYINLGTRNIDPIPKGVLDMAVHDYYYGVVDKLNEIGYPKNFNPISVYDALNGVSGDRFIKRVDEKTAAGLCYGKKKKAHLNIVYLDDDGHETPPGKGRKHLIPNKELVDNIVDILKSLVDRKFWSMFVRSCLKDEPSTGKIRIFGVLSMDMLLVGKMLFAPVASALLSIPLEAEMYQGISVLTMDWTEMYSHIIAFEPSQVGEGDYSKYDTSVSGQLIRAVGDILVNLARFLGYSEMWLSALATYIESVALNAWVYNGAIFIVDGWNPSGNWLTAIIGGMANALLHRSCFYSYIQRPLKFRKYVHLATLGDDSLFSTLLSWFNCITLSRYFASIGMKYTPADKEGELVPFVNHWEATFGKRTFRWEPAYSAFVAPLAIDSIMKSLHCYMESETDEMTITVGCVEQAILEFARHGKRLFTGYQYLLQQVCEEVGIAHMVNNLYYAYEDIIAEMFQRQFTTIRRVDNYGVPAALESTILQNEQEI